MSVIETVPELRTPAECAIELRCSVHSVKRWAREGQLSAVYSPGGTLLGIPLDELRRLQTHPRHSDRPADMRGASS